MQQYNRNHSYSCLLENIKEQAALSIPAAIIESSGNYECNISDSQVAGFSGFKSGVL